MRQDHLLANQEQKLQNNCEDHSPHGYINVNKGQCLEPLCIVEPSFGKPGTKVAEYCAEHCPDSYVDVKSKKCKMCDTQPSYGMPGTKLTEYCQAHKPAGYINVRDKTCLYPLCPIQPCFGQAGTKIAQYCSEHKPSDYVDVLSNRCIYLDCQTRPSFGKPGTRTAEYCEDHSPNNYVNVHRAQCLSCTKQPRYNYIGYSPQWCGHHKTKGMILNPIKRCQCKAKATHVDHNTYYCESHMTATVTNLQNVCSICCASTVALDQHVCVTCNIAMKDGKTIKRKLKELEVKAALENHNIEIDSYDRVVAGGCSKRRPDFIINRDGYTIVLECDEEQHSHKSYPRECEITRMKQIYFDLGIEHGKLLFVRYNPDGYTPGYGGVFTTIRRLGYLVKYLKSDIDLHVGVNVLYLFYDGFSEISPEMEYLDPYETQTSTAVNPFKIVIKKRLPTMVAETSTQKIKISLNNQLFSTMVAETSTPKINQLRLVETSTPKIKISLNNQLRSTTAETSTPKIKLSLKKLSF